MEEIRAKESQMTGQLILPPDPYIAQIYNLMQGKSEEEKEAMVRAAKEASKAYPQKKQKSIAKVISFERARDKMLASSDR